ncbi:MAG: succinylglutamate desuccinylase/aspartoacylase family protein [Vicinamibacterales bacterium]|nr:succinylglutamate desuccinylase/aspartoacylase family protein [Vicinamibacterales bacterium]
MRAILLTGVVCLVAAAAGAQVTIPAGTPATHDIRPGPGVTATRLLSEWAPALAGTPGDTTVYVLDGQEPGATVFVAGGTHGNEIAGVMAAIVLVERLRVQTGRLIVVPHANNSAITDVDPERPGPEFITLSTPSGERRFRYGSRRTKAAHQGAPDPPTYRHPASAEELAGTESRNLNRAYPGVAEGTLTQRMAHAILQIIQRERATLAFDFHEAGPESRLAWMVVANPKNIDTAAAAVLDLEAQGLSMKLEPSSVHFRGLSHREWGDASPAQAFLFETASPSMVNDMKEVDFVNDPKLPLAKRVGGQLASFAAVLAAYNADARPGTRVSATGLPTMAEVRKTGVGALLR